MLAIAHSTPADPDARRRLAQAGASVFELDVRLVGGRLVSTHTVRMLWRSERLRRQGWRLRLGPPHSVDVHALELAAQLPASCRVLLDCKDDSGQSAGRLAAAITAQVPDPSRFVVSSHHWESLRPLAAAGFEIWASVGGSRSLAALRAHPVRCDAVTVRHTLLKVRRVERLLAAYPRVLAWTVNSVPRVEQLAVMGVGGITSDRAEVLGYAAGRRVRGEASG